MDEDLYTVCATLNSPISDLPDLSKFTDDNGKSMVTWDGSIIETDPGMIDLVVPQVFLEKTVDLLEDDLFTVESWYRHRHKQSDRYISQRKHEVLEIETADHQVQPSNEMMPVGPNTWRVDKQHILSVWDYLKKLNIPVKRLHNVTQNKDIPLLKSDEVRYHLNRWLPVIIAYTETGMKGPMFCHFDPSQLNDQDWLQLDLLYSENKRGTDRVSKSHLKKILKMMEQGTEWRCQSHVSQASTLLSLYNQLSEIERKIIQ